MGEVGRAAPSWSAPLLTHPCPLLHRRPPPPSTEPAHLMGPPDFLHTAHAAGKPAWAPEGGRAQSLPGAPAPWARARRATCCPAASLKPARLFPRRLPPGTRTPGVVVAGGVPFAASMAPLATPHSCSRCCDLKRVTEAGPLGGGGLSHTWAAQTPARTVSPVFAFGSVGTDWPRAVLAQVRFHLKRERGLSVLPNRRARWGHPPSAVCVPEGRVGGDAGTRAELHCEHDLWER